MTDIAIRVENLSKQYRIGARQAAYRTLREALTDAATAPFRRLWRNPQPATRNPQSDLIWALKDVSFEVKRGEVVGIIGRNGAGKTTLLKVLSRITEPTEGRATIRGRVGSLLEVGTGFHPELTGRENIYLNGAILGMKRAEIELKFDEIVDFSGVEKFIDTPVKHYSSGMYVRLAFAVAAHLEPEILLVDEVLAVGDAAFQKKCLGKMGDVAREGRTVLFVSHNMVALQSLCPRAIWLHDGHIRMEGESAQVVSDYLQSTTSLLTEQTWDDVETARGNEMVRLHRMCVRPENGSSSASITAQTPFVIEVEFWNLAPGTYLNLTLNICTEQGIVAFSTSSIHEAVWHGRALPMGLFRSTCHIPGNLLNTGIHRVRLLVVKDQGHIIYRYDDALSFEVLDSVEARGAWYGKMQGVVRPMLKWTTNLVKSESEGGFK